MPQTTRTFRIFVSSTFNDLKEERNALQEQVFPQLREFCMQHGIRFQAVDLRWGVSEEAGQDQQTMKICLSEIERCQKTTPRPNFIVLLGDRYGWCPLPAEVPAREFEEILRRLPTDKLRQWYQRDDNASLPVYCLLPREGELRDFANWEPVEHELRAILLKATEQMSPEQRLKYVASATEQEIVRGALQVEDAREQVFCFFRTINDLPRHLESAKDFVDLDTANNLDRLARHPALTFQQALNEPDATAPAQAARQRVQARQETRPHVRWINKPQAVSPCLMTIIGHRDELSSCDVSPDGARIVSASSDKELKVWDAADGKELLTLRGHGESCRDYYASRPHRPCGGL